MQRFRKLMLAAVAMAALVTPMADASPVQAHDGYSGVSHSYGWNLYYRSCPHSAWCYYGTFTCQVQLSSYMAYLQGLGYEVYIY